MRNGHAAALSTWAKRIGPDRYEFGYVGYLGRHYKAGEGNWSQAFNYVWQLQ